MLKRIMLYLMMLLTAMKFLALTFVFSTNIERLPIPVYISAGAIVLFGIVLTCKHILKSVTKRALTWFYICLSVSVIFNLIFMKVFSRVEVNLIDFAIIGTAMDILVGATLAVMAARENKYVRIHVSSSSDR